MSKYVKATRWPICIPSALMVIVSFALAQRPLSEALIVAVVVFLIAASTMVVNDYVDRDADFEGGKKVFAHDEPKKYIIFTVMMWCVSFVGSLALATLSWRYTFLALFLCVMGLAYSFSRKYLVLPSVMVAGITALAASFPLMEEWYPTVATLAAVAFIAISGREEVKNLEDFEQDKKTGWKLTLPCSIGRFSGAIVARNLWVVAVIVLVALPSTVLSQPIAWALAMMVTAVAVAALILDYFSASKAKITFDLGMTVFLLTAVVLYASVYGVGAKGANVVMALFVVLLLWLTSFVGKVLAEKKQEDDSGPFLAFHESMVLWSCMYFLMGGIVWGLRTLCIIRLEGHARDDAVLLAAYSLAAMGLMLVLNMRKRWESGREIVNSMSLGLAIGLIAVAGKLVGLPAAATAIIVPFASIVGFGTAHPLTRLLKNHACIVGIVTAIGIVFGLNYAVTSFAVAYAVVVLLYYVKAYREKLISN